MLGTAGWTTLPPAAKLYAVEPVGVANLCCWQIELSECDLDPK